MNHWQWAGNICFEVEMDLLYTPVCLILVQAIKWFGVQFGINKHKQKNLHETVGQVQFVVFEKLACVYLLQLTWEKSFDYLLMIYKWQFLSRFSILRDKWRQQATSTLLDKNLTIQA